VESFKSRIGRVINEYNGETKMIRVRSPLGASFVSHAPAHIALIYYPISNIINENVLILMNLSI
jgi:hypothetical protein